MAYKLKLNWGAKIRILTVLKNDADRSRAEQFMKDLVDLARLPHIETMILSGAFHDNVEQSPPADINMFGLSPGLDLKIVGEMVERTDTSCVFVLDSGVENILA